MNYDELSAQVPRSWHSRVSVASGNCWLWQGGASRGGYGKLNGTHAHREFYERLIGPVPAGLELDHLCSVILCVNPDHLEPVTHDENMRRRYASYNSCVNGHAYTSKNTYVRPNGRRDCRACIRERVRRYAARQRGEALAPAEQGETGGACGVDLGPGYTCQRPAGHDGDHEPTPDPGGAA